jgi:hypothetical protein
MLCFHENIDRAVTVEMRPQGIARGIILQVYQQVRAAGLPLSYQVAQALLAQPVGHVGFLAGLVFPPHLPNGEIDGPVGSVVLGHSLSMLGHRVTVFVEEPIVPVMEALTGVLGLDQIQIVDAWSVADNEWDKIADDLDALIAVEKLGVNRKGQRHAITGVPFDSGYPYADHLVKRLNAQNKLTIGFGDGGNEIGFGSVFDLARQIVPHGRDCGCPCGDGIITSTATRFLFPASTSNFGAYGVAAALALQTRCLEILPRPEDEIPLLEAALDAGCLDGGSGRRIAAEDGIPAETAVAVLRILETIVGKSQETFDRAF